MFRAGTTFLSNLLDDDPANRALLGWESQDSVPPPTPDERKTGPRVDAAQGGVDMLEMLNPAISAIHHEAAADPTECIAVMGQAFQSISWEAIANVPSYGAWWRAGDNRAAYDYHRLVLQTLQSGGVRGRWTLKSPHHALALDALVDTYPDARLVLLHRDPVDADRLGVQPDQRHVEHVLRRRPPRLHRRALERHARGVDPPDRRLPGPPPRAPDPRRPVRRPGPRPGRHRPRASTTRSGSRPATAPSTRWPTTSPRTRAGSSAGTATTSPSSGSPRPPYASGSAGYVERYDVEGEHLTAPTG